MSRGFGWLLTMALLVAGMAFGVPQSAHAAASDSSARYFSPTGHWVQGDFLTFFDTHGGLDLFGYPRTEEIYSDGRLVQYFQRARFESWPENPPPFNVQLALLGDLVTGPGDPPVAPPSDRNILYFPQTGHSLSGPFRSFFEQRGGLAIFGYPTSEPKRDSSGFQVQRFQRARLELHPELPDPYTVSLGLLGDQYIFSLEKVPADVTLPVSSIAPPSAGGVPSGQMALQTSPGGNLVVENLDGTNSHVIAPGLDPAWSPDGKQIAFAQWGGEPGIYLVNADGSGLHQLYAQSFTRDPQWSPDGKQISFYRRYDGVAIVNGVQVPDDWFQVMVINVATRSIWLPWNQQTHAYASTWSPDGQKLVFQQYDGLYVVNVSGPDLIPHLIPNTDLSFSTPSWSPDGQHILFTYQSHDHWNVGLINPDGSGFRLLTYDPLSTTPSNSASGSWSPDGKKILFISDRSGSWQPYVMNADGSHVTPLNGQQVVYQGASARVLAWKP